VIESQRILCAATELLSLLLLPLPVLFVMPSDDNGCTLAGGDPCNSANMPNSIGTCYDVAAPGTGYTCGCITGATWVNGACQGACVDGPHLDDAVTVTVMLRHSMPGASLCHYG
jgi:hypothetical protein